MPLSRLVGFLLVLAVAGAFAPGALARKAPPPAPSTQVAPGLGVAAMVAIEALR